MLDPNSINNLTNLKHMVVDGSYLTGRSEAVILVMNAETCKPIYGKYGLKETFPNLRQVFLEMKDLGCNPISATIDGLPATSKALYAVWPNIKIQRCVIHIQRQGLMWCRAKPKRRDAKKLRKILLDITNINNQHDKQKLLEMVEKWEWRYGFKIANAKEMGWIFSDLKRARSMLIKALNDSFCYLENPKIPHSTNLAEGCFSRLKGLLRDHRGIKGKRREQLFKWFLARRK